MLSRRIRIPKAKRRSNFGFEISDCGLRMTNYPLRVLVAGGGTGGHVFPALAIADEIKKIRPDAEFLFVGTKDKIESRVVPERGYRLSTIWISGFHRSLRPANLLFPLKVLVSLAQSFGIVRRFDPTIAIGTGGYVCGPILSMAAWMGIPVVVHEANSYPGVTTRMLAGRAKIVFTSFEATTRWLKRTDNVEHVGMPTRQGLDASERSAATAFFKLDPAKKTVFVFGGSLGAASINRAVEQRLIPAAAVNGFQIIWQTGRGWNGDIVAARQAGWVGAFIDDMQHAYAAADIVVCRSGASSLAELTLLGKPAILVPYPHAAADHQTVNARSLSERGAAVLLPDAEVTERLVDEVMNLLSNDERRLSMANASRNLGRPNAGTSIAARIVQLSRN